MTRSYWTTNPNWMQALETACHFPTDARLNMLITLRFRQTASVNVNPKGCPWEREGLPVQSKLTAFSGASAIEGAFFFDSIGSCNASKAGEEPFRGDVDRVGGWSLFLLIKLRPACSDVEPYKVFDGCKIGGSHILP
jgi:hypothetical protein